MCTHRVGDVASARRAHQLRGLSCPRSADGPGRWRWHEDADSKVATAPLQATEMDGVRAGRRHASSRHLVLVKTQTGTVYTPRI
eukprot:scaffold125493_cov42-Phaeocystis_antarctica.AAC.2